MSDLNLYSVNWQDGMLISQSHLKDQERYFSELARWYALSAADQYGLVRKAVSGQPALALNFSVNGNRVRVEVTRCQAITSGGHVIEINESNQGTVVAEANMGTDVLPVFIATDPKSKKQVGDPDPQEDIPRIPYLAGSYTLYLGEKPSLPEEQFVQITELIKSGEEVVQSDQYFPPCLSISADERLNTRATELRNRLENLLSLASRAYTAIAQSGALADQSSSLQVAFKDTTYNFAFYLSSVLDRFVVARNGLHPLQLVILFKGIFRVFTTLLNLRPGLKDYLNERFFIKQLNSEVGQFMASVDAFLLSEYNHRDIGGQVRMIDDTLKTLRGILGFLAQLKGEQLGPQAVATDTLTYAGKTYRLVTYGSSRLEQAGELSYLLIDLASPQAIADLTILMSKDLFSTAEWNGMQVRLGLNEARGLGETDPIDIDSVTFGDKAALHPQDMLKSPSVNQITLVFRGARDASKLAKLGSSELVVYAV